MQKTNSDQDRYKIVLGTTLKEPIQYLDTMKEPLNLGAPVEFVRDNPAFAKVLGFWSMKPKEFIPQV